MFEKKNNLNALHSSFFNRKINYTKNRNLEIQAFSAQNCFSYMITIIILFKFNTARNLLFS